MSKSATGTPSNQSRTQPPTKYERSKPGVFRSKASSAGGRVSIMENVQDQAGFSGTRADPGFAGGWPKARGPTR